MIQIHKKCQASQSVLPRPWAAMLRDSVVVVIVVVVVVHTRPRAIPLAMITMGKSTHGFLFLSYMSMGLR